MIKLRRIKLVNFCGYKDFEIDLTEGDGVKRWAMFYGPNGSFKSTFLRAVELLSSPRQLRGRLNNNFFLRRLTYHSNYQPTYIGFDTNKTNLFMEGVFYTDNGDKRVVLENNWNDKIGITVDELPPEMISASAFIDADNPNNMFSFQLAEEYRDKFLDIVSIIYDLQCYLPRESMVSEYNPEINKYINFFTDFIITKHGNTLVHYKSFSDGEKKIATLIAALFRKSREADIILIDNIDQHVYFRRHMTLIAKIEEIFPDKQFIATTHSSVIVNTMDPKLLIDMEKNIL